MKPVHTLTRKVVGPCLYAHVEPGSNLVRAIECLLCRDIIYEKGPGPYVSSGLIKAIRLHFFLAHDIDAIDLPERK